ncbi:MAG: thioredoxin domain-containing protein [Beijerinckiaceae bacterium]|nr:MAG: thioredoxin domain-containing protein [Beijerinckiaceae bacterium]
MSSNELAHAASPYLLQHANNPVHWHMWGEAALREAQESNKPILLSVGYAACHWCHVMAHESFEDAETAAVMNELFVNIKVDREERPDIDHIYMSALHSFGERGGWPMTMFLTPQGEPFWGGTYFPKTEQYGRPAFVTVLRSVAEIFHTEPEKIAQNTKVIREALSHKKQSESGTLAADLLDSLPPQIAGFADRTNGGLRGAPKFPNTPIFELLWRAGAHLGKAPYRDLVRLTLTRMSKGGIYDHLGGGFARYSVDAYWRVPHFEKMLYDNAQLLELLALCHREFGDPLLRQRAREIVAWLSREMTTPEGAFCASLDADSEGEEGRFYVWSWDELVSVLGEEDARFFGRFYDAGPEGNWDDEPHGKIVTVLNQLKADPPPPEEEARLAALRQKLFLVREKRPHPGLDDKIMADWNGLMIAALVNAGTTLGEPSWVSQAGRAYAAIVELLQYTNDSGQRRLAHSTRAGAIVKPGFALDHAAMLRAALALHEARHMEGAQLPPHDYLGDAIAWAEAVRDDYLDQETGLLAMSTADAGDVILRLSPTNDDAIPNAHPVYLTGLIRLAGLTGDDAWLTLADQLMATLAPVVRENFAGHAGILNALDLRLNGLEIVTAGTDRKTLYEAALAVPFDRRIVIDLDRPETFPANHPAAAQAKIAGEAAAFVCTKGTCSAPVHDVAALERLLASFTPAGSAA